MSKLDLSKKDLKDSDLLKKLHNVKNDIQYEELDLSYNNLTSLPDLRKFRQFDGLKVLNLWHNNVTHIDFSLIPPTVTKLNLSFNELNGIRDLSCCTELKYLDVSYNQITHVHWRNLPPALKRLDLGKNQLRTVGNCSHLTQLSVLSVGSNRINQIDWRNLPPALTRLDLYNNQLTAVDLFHCIRLERLDLDNNSTLHWIQSLPNRSFHFDINSSVRVLEEKCFHENTYGILKKKCKKIKWELEQPPVEVLLQGLEAVLEYYKEKPIRTTHSR